MSAPAIRTIKAKDVIAGKEYLFEQDKTEILDYTVDFTGCLNSSQGDPPEVDLSTAGIAVLGFPTMSGLSADFVLSGANATYGQEYPVTVRVYEDAQSPSAAKVEISFTVVCKDL